MTFVGPVHFYDFYSQLCNSLLLFLASFEINLDHNDFQFQSNLTKSTTNYVPFKNQSSTNLIKSVENVIFHNVLVFDIFDEKDHVTKSCKFGSDLQPIS